MTLKEDRIKHWLSHGATPSDRVGRFLGEANLIPMPPRRNNPIKGQPGAKAQERTKEADEAKAAKKAAAEEAAKAPPPPPPEEPKPEESAVETPPEESAPAAAERA